MGSTIVQSVAIFNSSDRPYKGLKMAILDRKVQIFALMNASQLLGSSFTQFFPTSVKLDTYE